MPHITPEHLPLQGITVVDFGQYIAAPGATQTLADLGAEVIKVENPRGDQARSIGSYGESIMRAYNRRKKSVVVDMKSEAGLAQARALIRTTDVVVSNLRPGAMDRLGLTVDAIRELNTSVIYAEVTGFGKKGPSRNGALRRVHQAVRSTRVVDPVRRDTGCDRSDGLGSARRAAV